MSLGALWNRFHRHRHVPGDWSLPIETAGLADGAVTSAKIADGTIATGDIADGAVTSAKIADGTIATGDIADGAVTSAKIADGTIVNADISASAAIALSKIASSVEAASYTPTLKGSSTTGSFVYGLRSGRYAQIGPVVVCTFTVNVSSVSSGATGDALISLPVTSSSQTNLYGACAIEVSNVGFTAGYTYTTGRVPPSASDLGLLQNGSGAAVAALPAASIAAGYQVLGTVVYLAA